MIKSLKLHPAGAQPVPKLFYYGTKVLELVKFHHKIFIFYKFDYVNVETLYNKPKITLNFYVSVKRLKVHQWSNQNLFSIIQNYFVLSITDGFLDSLESFQRT